MYEAVFRITDNGLVAAATADADVRVTLWCNDYCDLLHVVGADADGVVAAIADTVGVHETAVGRTGRLVVTRDCLQSHLDWYVERYLQRHDCLLLGPLRYEDGSKRVRLLSIDPEGLTGVYRDLVDEGHDVTVERKRELTMLRQREPLLTLEEILPDLTDRQHEAFVVAHENGYYETPRETTTAAIADQMGVERRTAEEHLRRAERKVADAVVPYL